MRSLVRGIPAFLIFGIAAACGGSTSNGSSDAGTHSSGDAQSTVQDAGAVIDSPGVVKTGASTPGFDMEPDIQEWSAEGDLILFSFTLVVDPALKLQSVDGANVWFDGDTPHAFGFGQDTDLGSSTGGGYEWDGAVSNNPGARVNLTLDTASNGAITSADARPYSPYGAGNLHVLLYGTLNDGSEWQASTMFTAQ
jgi:hypothetical protein